MRPHDVNLNCIETAILKNLGSESLEMAECQKIAEFIHWAHADFQSLLDHELQVAKPKSQLPIQPVMAIVKTFCKTLDKQLRTLLPLADKFKAGTEKVALLEEYNTVIAQKRDESETVN
jgi:hypothetical protein